MYSTAFLVSLRYNSVSGVSLSPVMISHSTAQASAAVREKVPAGRTKPASRHLLSYLTPVISLSG
jgi:hypothetical protein